MSETGVLSAGERATLATSLLLLRLTIAVFLALWTMVKLAAPERALGVYDKFYKPIFQVDLPLEAFLGVGALQAAIVLAFALGLLKFWSYGAVLVMHGVSTLSTWRELMDPATSPNLLFWAAVPVLASCLALFLLRRWDAYALGR